MESFTQLPLAPPSSSCTTASSSTSLWVFHSEAAAPAAPTVEREHMFNKLLTPSDVGKLNRLVIPKLYAEKYFPLDLSSADKGLQLCFEDRNGKKWPFRYSYWNSSQSYVMTKGWSRFVKEKKLDAGDTISFGRGVGESGQGHLFIGWHRRELPQHRPPLYSTQFSSTGKSLVPWAGVLPSPTLSMYNVANLGTHGAEQPCFYSRPMEHRPHVRVQVSGGGDRIVDAPMVLDSVPVGRGVTGPKRVRLFGVNLESFERPEGHGPNQKAVPLVQPKSPLQWSLGFAETSVTWTGNRQQRSMNLKFKFSEKFQIKEID